MSDKTTRGIGVEVRSEDLADRSDRDTHDLDAAIVPFTLAVPGVVH